MRFDPTRSESSAANYRWKCGSTIAEMISKIAIIIMISITEILD